MRPTFASRRDRSVAHAPIAVSAALLVLLASMSGAMSPSAASEPPIMRPLVVRAHRDLAAAERLATQHPRSASQSAPVVADVAPDRLVDAPERTITMHPAQTDGGSSLSPSGEPDAPIVASPVFAGADPSLAPDPWMAVGPSHVLEVTSRGIRITDRRGVELSLLPSWAFFAAGLDEMGSHARVIFDAARGRWIGAMESYDPDRVDCYLNIAVSDGASPLGAWTVYAVSFGDVVPDDPAIASSSDKLVIAVDEYRGGDLFEQASMLVLPWTKLAPGASLGGSYITYPGLRSIRPAQVLSSSADVHLVANVVATGEIVHARASGSVATPPTFAGLGVGAAWDPAAPLDLQPRQAGNPPTISQAVDHRVIDAVWRAGQLWFVSTYPVTTDGGATWELRARATHVAVSTGAPSVVADWLVGESGTDTYAPGVGISGDGTVFVAYSRSSPTERISARAKAWRATGWSPELLVATSDASLSTMPWWSRYVGVAADPAQVSVVWHAAGVVDSYGQPRTVVARLVLDEVAPTTTIPTQALVANTTLGPFAVPVRISWGGSDAGSGIARYELMRCWEPTCYDAPMTHEVLPGSTTSTLKSHWWAPAATADPDDRQFRAQYVVTARDGYNTAGGWAIGPALTPVVTQQTTSVTYVGSWRTASSTAFSGGSARYTSSPGARAEFSFYGRSVAFVSYRSSTRGKVKVYVDGTYKGTVSLKGTTTKSRQIVYAYTWTKSGTHRLRIVVSSGRVDVDAFVVLK